MMLTKDSLEKSQGIPRLIAVITICIELISSFSLKAAESDNLKNTIDNYCLIKLESCDHALGAAEDVIQKGEELIGISREKMKIQQEQYDLLAKEHARLLAKEKSFIGSPGVWFIIGSIVGGVMIAVATHDY